ncbi:ATP-binding cassette domain-containing protein [Chelatococcus asaccharovorans]|uniref:Peptide/nickel transport system ATP-binding protein n=1 Tax=Chelatococcus asaccharovorans TaxID=28210 RepID=A0A2V3UBZ1_9HYPH|nr:ATP-binding cassette domain-containing protein [Chelatococcus asaccharovorans]MBS7703614.1 ATP-binding cassette domain-containing protein [Chelatococcus asaccharovorans]PXW61959.1 peptide/nickel transport system ATP-binding protein [Chelatococcus asaccharovorans]
MSERYVDTRRFLAPAETLTGKVQRVGMVILAVIMLSAICAPLLTSYAPRDSVCRPFATPTAAHLLGCNDAGQDLFSQLLYGARISLAVGLSVAVLSTLLATIIAVVAGFNGGLIDRLIMRLVDIILCLPFMPLVIVLGVFFGASIRTQVLVIAFVMWAPSVRELRAQILQIRSSAFVEASLAMGASGYFVGIRHLVPELAPLIVPQFVRIAHNAILVETSLSFLGLGDPLQNSWGSILFHANARTAFLTGAWVYWVMPPGLAVSLTVLSLALIGFGYDASLAPRIRRRLARPIERPAGAAPRPGAVLSVQKLHVSWDSEFGRHEVVHGVDLDLRRGELLGLVGESGSGKTTLSMAILRLLRPSASVTRGAIWLNGEDLLRASDATMRRLRGRRIALIPQSAMNALNPVLTIGAQLGEALDQGGRRPPEAREAAIVENLLSVGLEARHALSFPHELSGGMRQRAVIAIALCNRPEVVIADEPTTGLDVLVQEDIMALLLDLRRRLDLSILFVTHNLPLIARHADRLAVMCGGTIVEEGAPDALRRAPRHTHTRALFESLPALVGDRRWQAHADTSGPAEAPLIELRNVSKTFRRRSLGAADAGEHQALNDVSLTLAPGEKLGLVGGSGAGKSTIARLCMGVLPPDEGTVFCQGKDIASLGMRRRQIMSEAIHLVFQDPYQSLRNGMSVRDIVAEPLRIRGERDPAVIHAKVRAALAAAKLPHDGAFISRLPIALSGGQRQRVAFARAVVVRPKLIIADEPTSMLDQSVRMEIMDLMESLARENATAFLLITHDIALARHFCDRLAVLRQGRIVEEGLADTIVQTPQNAYTRALIAAA